MTKTKLHHSLILLTALVIFIQLAFFLATHIVKNDTVKAVVTHASLQLTSAGILLPICQFLFAEICIYIFFIAATWYLAQSVGELFQLREKQIYYVGLLIFFCSVILIVAANCYLFPNMSTAVFFNQIATRSPFMLFLF